MENYYPMRETLSNQKWKKGDLLVIFGEVFNRGYVNGLIEEAEKVGMKVLYGTVGRRDADANLRPLTSEEIKEKNQPNLINIPLEAGFDMSPSKDGTSPCDQLKGVKREQWPTHKLDWGKVEESRKNGRDSFRDRTSQFLAEVEKHTTPETNILFAHTMAGGIPRAKILMPILNRIFKGFDARFQSSKEFWDCEIGKLCAQTFDDVTANTLYDLIDLSAALRGKVDYAAYVAYGYHGCEALVDGEYVWQSYAPYLQGWSKLTLENIAKEAFQKDIPVTVFNCPEILTNSSSVFLGVEVCLYPLLSALKLENNGQETPYHEVCQNLLNDEWNLDQVHDFTQKYLSNDAKQTREGFESWPKHNTSEQMKSMRQASDHLIEMHKDRKTLMTGPLSEVVFRSCGKAMFRESSKPRLPVTWLGHDIVAKLALEE